MKSEVKIIRLSTGEDMIGKVVMDTTETVTVNKAFVLIPRQSAPGQPIQLMLTPYMPYSADDDIIINHDKIVTIVKPKDDIVKSYQQNTSSILTPNKELITETKLP